nr:MAG TPA: hypothetical protein [Caudoviricetes sp.]
MKKRKTPANAGALPEDLPRNLPLRKMKGTKTPRDVKSGPHGYLTMPLPLAQAADLPKSYGFSLCKTTKLERRRSAAARFAGRLYYFSGGRTLCSRGVAPLRPVRQSAGPVLPV